MISKVGENNKVINPMEYLNLQKNIYESLYCPQKVRQKILLKGFSSILNRTKSFQFCFNAFIVVVKNILGNSLLQLIQRLEIFLKSVKHFCFQDTKEGLHHAIIYAGSLARHGWTYAFTGKNKLNVPHIYLSILPLTIQLLEATLPFQFLVFF